MGGNDRNEVRTGAERNVAVVLLVVSLCYILATEISSPTKAKPQRVRTECLVTPQAGANYYCEVGERGVTTLLIVTRAENYRCGLLMYCCSEDSPLHAQLSSLLRRCFLRKTAVGAWTGGASAPLSVLQYQAALELLCRIDAATPFEP